VIRLTEAELIHMRLLEKWRGAMNLVGPGPLEPHFQDAARAVEGLGAEGVWADLGSGAGFPGIALAARYPAVRVLLIESRQKRAEFLRTVIEEAGLPNAVVIEDRVEEITGGWLDGVVARAYKPPLDYLSDAWRLLRPGGLAVLMLGAAADEPTLPIDWGLESVATYDIGDGLRARAVLKRT
jgi:16S rRNA (guanine527-N7)-methyltransferase